MTKLQKSVGGKKWINQRKQDMNIGFLEMENDWNKSNIQKLKFWLWMKLAEATIHWTL